MTDILRDDGGGQAVVGVVRDRDRFRVGRKGCDGRDWPENLFHISRHGCADVGKNGGFDEKPISRASG